MKLIIDQVSILDSQLKPTAAYAAAAMAGLVGFVNGVRGDEVGPVPGFLVQGSNEELAVGIASGATLTYRLVGMVASIYDLPKQEQANDYIFAEAGQEWISVAYLQGLRVQLEAYATRNEGDTADLTYGLGEALYRSTYGCLTKDNSTSSDELGYVAAINADGTITAVLN